MNIGRAVPSAISTVRLLIAIPVISAILDRDTRTAAALCAAGGVSDFLDGFLARRYDWATRAGAWLDAVADKVLLSGIFVAFYLVETVPLWFVALVFGRDVLILLMACIGLALTPLRDFPPSVWGKVSTGVQIGAALVLLAGPVSLVPAALGIAALATAWSGLHYFLSALHRLRGLRAGAD